MPVFQYDQYRNPYGPSIAQALEHQGDIQAAGALQAGDLQADATRRSGALRAQMWGMVGNAFTAIPQQMRANRELELKEQQQRQQMALSAMTLEDRQRQRAAETAFSKALAETPLNDDGTYNVPAIQKAIDPAFGQYAIPQFQHIESVNTALTGQRQKERAESGQALQGIIASGSNPVFANSWLVTAGARGHISQEDMTNARAQIAEDPTQTEAVLRRFAGPQKGENVPKDTIVLDPLTHTPIYSNVQPDKPTEASLAVDLSSPDPAVRQRAQTALDRLRPTGTAEERIASLYGREQAGETLNAADKAVLEGWKLKEGNKPFTVKTVENGRPVERVMTTADAMKQGLFVSPPTAAAQNAETGLVKVEHQDANGNTVVEWMPKSEVRGQTFQKGTSAALQNRLASATAVNQTGNDIIARLSDPATAATVGPIMGRFNSLRDFIGNPPPELAELAGQIESYALANMGVHGMRSVEGAAKINKMLDTKTTPAGLIATIKGLQGFSTHLLENEGRTVPAPAPPPAATGANPFRR